MKKTKESRTEGGTELGGAEERCKRFKGVGGSREHSSTEQPRMRIKDALVVSTHDDERVSEMVPRIFRLVNSESFPKTLSQEKRSSFTDVESAAGLPAAKRASCSPSVRSE